MECPVDWWQRPCQWARPAIEDICTAAGSGGSAARRLGGAARLGSGGVYRRRTLLTMHHHQCLPAHHHRNARVARGSKRLPAPSTGAMCATACVRVRGGVASARATGSGRRALRPRLRARCAGASRGSRSSEEEAGDAGGASSGGGLSPAPLEQTYTFHTPGATQEPTPTPATGTVFRHQTDEGREAWRNTTVTHLGEGLEMEHVRLAVVIGEFHNTLMDDCLDDAKASAEAMGSFITDVTWVPGTYEAPLVVRDYLQRDSIDAVVVLGYIEVSGGERALKG